ncbi:putative nucleic acid-binding, replication factor A [Helianthus debilis subsp. tardiflorus]
MLNMYEKSDMQNCAITTTTNLEVPISHLLQSNAGIIGKRFTIKGKITEVMSDKNWHYNACPKCRQTLIQTGSKWFCVDDGTYDKAVPNTKCRYQILVKISDNTGTINGTVFDQAANQLLQQTCEETLTKENQTQLLQSMKNREAHFQVQAEQDLKNRSIRCTVNSANYLQPQTNYTSTSTPSIPTPKPVTPPPKIQNTSSAKRSLNMLEGPEAMPSKKTRSDDTTN